VWTHHSLQQSTGLAPGASSRTFAPEELAGRLHNFVLTEEGTLRTVVGPVEYRPHEIEGEPEDDNVTYNGPLKGLFHAVVNGRGLLIAHYGDTIYLFEGWSRRWRTLVGLTLQAIVQADYARSRAVAAKMDQSDSRPGFPTQFVALPNGVVIIPQGERTYFTDGRTILPLGYDRAPAPPRAWGPRDEVDPTSDNLGGGAGEDPVPSADELVNTGGYSHRGRDLVEPLGNGRLGTIRNDSIDVVDASKKSNPLGGILEDGEWRAGLQWQDHFGNLSPLSGLSDPARVHTESNITKTRKKDAAESSDRMRPQLAWTGLQDGPLGTVGKLLGRTRDLKNSGIPGVFQVPNYATSGQFQSVTVPGNTVQIFPDNIPDSWLLLPMVEPVPVPRMSVASQFDGKLWVDDVDRPGLIRPSRPFQWGTFEKGLEIWIDTQGSRVTGLHAVPGGMLAFTESAAFLVTPNDTGRGYITRPLSLTVGCVAPGSIQTLTTGQTLWLGREGFYAFDNGAVFEVSGDIKQDVIRRINKGFREGACSAVDTRMGEYRCGVPVDGSETNNLVVVYTPSGWRTRDDIHPADMCVTADQRQLMLALGQASVDGTRRNSVWVLDHAGDGTRVADPVEAVYESVWLRNARAHRNATPRNVRFWLRATGDRSVTLETFRDGKKYPPLQAETSTLYREAEAFTPLWGETLLGGDHKDEEVCDTLDHYWTRRQLFWTTQDIYIPASEVFRFRLKATGGVEFVMAMYDETDSYGGGAKHQGEA